MATTTCIGNVRGPVIPRAEAPKQTWNLQPVAAQTSSFDDCNASTNTWPGNIRHAAYVA